MAKTNTTASVTRSDLRNMLLNGVKPTTAAPADERTAAEWIDDVASDAASTVFDTTARVAGAFASSFKNGAQAFKLERNFRDVERSVKMERLVDRYEARLAKLA